MKLELSLVQTTGLFSNSFNLLVKDVIPCNPDISEISPIIQNFLAQHETILTSSLIPNELINEIRNRGDKFTIKDWNFVNLVFTTKGIALLKYALTDDQVPVPEDEYQSEVVLIDKTNSAIPGIYHVTHFAFNSDELPIIPILNKIYPRLGELINNSPEVDTLIKPRIKELNDNQNIVGIPTEVLQLIFNYIKEIGLDINIIK